MGGGEEEKEKENVNTPFINLVVKRGVVHSNDPLGRTWNRIGNILRKLDYDILGRLEEEGSLAFLLEENGIANRTVEVCEEVARRLGYDVERLPAPENRMRLDDYYPGEEVGGIPIQIFQTYYHTVGKFHHRDY